MVKSLLALFVLVVVVKPAFGQATFDDFGGMITYANSAAAPTCPANPLGMTITSASQSGTTQIVVVSSLSTPPPIPGETMIITGTGTAMDWSYVGSTALAGASSIQSPGGISGTTIVLTGANSNTVSGVTSGTITPAYFYVAQIGALGGTAYEFCTPENHWMWINAVNPMPSMSASVFTTKYGSACQAAKELGIEIKAWGFNSTGVDDSDSTFDPSASSSCPSNPRIPKVSEVQHTLHALANSADNGVASIVAQPLHDTFLMIDSHYHPAPANDITYPDFFSALWQNYLTAQMAGGPVIQNQGKSPYFWANLLDDSDFTILPKAGGHFHTPSLKGYNGPHPSYRIICSSPLQAVAKHVAYGSGMSAPYVYIDPINYSKTPAASPPATCSTATPCTLYDYLHKEYSTIGALNAAWTSTYTTFGTSAICVGYTFSWCGSTTGVETFATGNGSSTSFTHTFANPTPSPESIQILLNGVPIGGDCPNFENSCGGSSGGGLLYGPGLCSNVTAYPTNYVITDPNGNIQQVTVAGVTSGTCHTQSFSTTVGATTTSGTVTFTMIGAGINSASSPIVYGTGSVSATIVTNNALASGATLTVNYTSCGWGCGTGLMDEDGRNTWVGTNPICLTQPPAWQAGHTYALNTQIHDATSASWQIITTAGTSGGSLPAFSATGGTIKTDGSAVWTSNGPPVCGTEATSDFRSLGTAYNFPNANAGADLDNWLSNLASAYYSSYRTAMSATMAGRMMGSHDVIFSYGAPPNIGTLQAAQQYSDFLYIGNMYPIIGGNVNGPEFAFGMKMSFATQYFTKPMVDFVNPTTAQSPFACSAVNSPNCFPSQFIMGQAEYTLLSTNLGQLSYNGTHQWAGWSHWSMVDAAAGSNGLKDPLDNAYNGAENVVGTVACSPPLAAYNCGGESSSSSWVGTNSIVGIGLINAGNLLWQGAAALPPATYRLGGAAVMSGSTVAQ